MPVRSPASSRSAERGAAVIVAMLTVAIVAALAAGIVAAFGFAVESLAGRHDLAQARWLARGGIDWSRNILADDKRRTSVDHLGESWATKVPPLQVDEGEVGGEIDDLSGKFNLNNLAWDGSADPDSQAAFVKLLAQLGVSNGQAKEQTERLTHWIDAEHEDLSIFGLSSDSTVTPPNAPLLSVDEILAIPGFDAALVERMRPFVTAVPPGSPLNVDTASAEVLSAWIPDLSLDQARALVASRNTAVFKDLADFTERMHTLGGGTSTTPSPMRFGVVTRYFLATGRAKYGNATTRMQVLLDRNERPWPEIRWQKIL